MLFVDSVRAISILLFISLSNAVITLTSLLGPHPVGTRRIEVTDSNRLDPLAPTPRPRSLMLQLWYPIASTDSLSPAPWLPANAAAFADQFAGLKPGTAEGIITHTYLNGTAIFPLLEDRKLPVLVFSPGSGSVSGYYSGFLSSLASYGYLVVGVDHPYDSDPVELPSGELIHDVLTDANNTLATVIRASDVDWLATQITVANLRSWLDIPSSSCIGDVNFKLGIFGHSIGGATGALAMQFTNTSYAAGASLDGPFYGPILTTGFNGPLLYMAAENSGNHQLLTGEWPLINGWKLAVAVNGSTHDSYTDFVVLVPQVPANSGIANYPIGTIDGARMMKIVVDYLKVYWNWTLLGKKKSELLKRPSSKFPEVVFENL